MRDGDELRTLRLRLAEAERRADRLGSPGPLGSDRMAVQVYDAGAIPTALGVFYATHPVVVAPGATEGAAASVSVDASRTIFVNVLGAVAPVAGDVLIAKSVDHRWVAEKPHPASGGIIVPGCPCYSSPASLTMTSSKPTSNGGMFQNATIVYGVTPTVLAPLNLGASCYLSTAYFPDLTTGDQFRYNFFCYFGYYILTRVYDTSVYGSPYRDQIRYRWPVGFPGDTCSPFSMASGAIYTGGDTTCIVAVYG